MWDQSINLSYIGKLGLGRVGMAIPTDSHYVPRQGGGPAMVACSSVPAPLRREQVLAFIVESLARDGRSPSVREIARALEIGNTRVKQLIGQLVEAGQLEKRPGTHGGLVVRDVAGARVLVKEALRALGFIDEAELAHRRGVWGCPDGQLPIIAAIEHHPGVDWPETP